MRVGLQEAEPQVGLVGGGSGVTSMGRRGAGRGILLLLPTLGQNTAGCISVLHVYGLCRFLGAGNAKETGRRYYRNEGGSLD